MLCYQTSLKLNPANAAPHVNMGVLLIKKHKPLESFQHFQNAIDINTLSRLAYRNMGLAYLSIRQWEDAERLLNESVSVSESCGDGGGRADLVKVGISLR